MDDHREKDLDQCFGLAVTLIWNAKTKEKERYIKEATLSLIKLKQEIRKEL